MVTLNCSRWRRHFPISMFFLKIQLNSHFEGKFHQATIFLFNTFFQPEHLKANGHSISEHLDYWSKSYQFFDLYAFVNLVYWNSLHPKNAILPTFSGQTLHFLGKMKKNWTNNLHHRKAVSVAVLLRVGVQHTGVRKVDNADSGANGQNAFCRTN